jgi:AcrR family transcriptional regulator
MNKNVASPRPRGRPLSFDRGEALERAMRLFWSHGYEGTSISELTEAMGLAPPSLYGAFGDKKRLFLEAVDHYEQTAGCSARKALTEEPTAERAVRGLLLAAVKSFASPQGPKGCLVVLGATNCSADSAAVGEALAARRRTAEAAVRARLAAGQAAGEFADHVDVDALADLVTTTVFGLAIKARDGASRARLTQVVEQFMAMWPGRDAAGQATAAASLAD